MDIRTGAQTTYQIGYHVVWGVKYHKHLLNQTMRKFLLTTVKQICESYDFNFYCLGLTPNHVHLFIGAAPKIAPAKIAQTVKSISAKAMFKQFPKTRQQLWGGEFWKNGYYVGTIGEGQTEAIILKYLDKQSHEDKVNLKQLKLFY